MNTLIKQVKEISIQIENNLIEYRRHFHKNPELSTQEKQTAEFISNILTSWGIEHTSNVGGYGIFGDIKGKNPESKMIALRADMDALPIFEENEIDYKSVNQGIMHACGHDVHMSCLLGSVYILNKFKDSFNGTVRFIFQPSEETFPGGAKAMIEAGVLKNPVPDFIIGQHVLPELEAGKFGFVEGKAMASTDEIYLTVKGKGGHAALPHMSTDTVLIASHIIVALQQIVSRKCNPLIPTVLSFGKIIGNGRTNILPDEVKIDGTIRTFDEQWRHKAHELIEKTAKNIAVSMGGECDVFIDKGYPFLINDYNLTKEMRNFAIDFVGEENALDIEARMTAEDFAYYSHIIPACFYRLGVKNNNWENVRNLHNSNFDADETSIAKGAAFMAYATIRKLNS